MFLIVPSPNPVPLHCARRCVHGSIPTVKPTLIRQSRALREWPAKSAHPLASPSPFCVQCHSLSSSTGSVSPCFAYHARHSPISLKNEKDSQEICNSLLLLPHILIFLWNRPLTNLLQGQAFKSNYCNKTAQAMVHVSAAQQACTDRKWYWQVWKGTDADSDIGRHSGLFFH